MRTFLIFSLMLFCVNFMCMADEPDWGGANIPISMSGHPKPHFADVSDPIAMYNTATDVLTVTLDATYYGEYTICIETTLATYDYYPTSATTVIPLAYVEDNMTIYIDSDECGCWYGELNKVEFGGQMDI